MIRGVPPTRGAMNVAKGHRHPDLSSVGMVAHKTTLLSPQIIQTLVRAQITQRQKVRQAKLKAAHCLRVGARVLKVKSMLFNSILLKTLNAL